MADQKRLGISSRQDQIINLVRDQGYASIEMMAEKFDVAQQTVRRDIIYLSEKGLLQRHHGGAGLPPGLESLAYSNRKVRNAQQKTLIAEAIASRVPNGASLFIDIGTTMEAVALALTGHEGLRVITNHVGVVSIFCENTDFEITISGGLVRNNDRAVTGETTTEFLRQFRVGYGIFGIGSITDDGHLLDYDYRDAQASRGALKISRHKIAAVDHSKFNGDAMMPFVHVSEMDEIFTDKEPPEAILNAIEQGGTEIFIATDSSLTSRSD